MPTGHPIPYDIRVLLVHHYFKGSTVEFVVENLFVPDTIHVHTIELLWSSLGKWTEDETNSYIRGGQMGTHATGKIEKDSQEETFLLHLLKQNRSMKIRVLLEQFHEQFYDEAERDNLPGFLCVYKAIRRAGLKRNRAGLKQLTQIVVKKED